MKARNLTSLQRTSVSTTKGETLYAFIMGWPTAGGVQDRASLALDGPQQPRKAVDVRR